MGNCSRSPVCTIFGKWSHILFTSFNAQQFVKLTLLHYKYNCMIV